MFSLELGAIRLVSKQKSVVGVLGLEQENQEKQRMQFPEHQIIIKRQQLKE